MDKREAEQAKSADGGFSYLLVQLGMHSAGMFAARLAPLGLEPRQFGVLSRVAANEGKTQQAIAKLIGLNATRMVFLVDELERMELAERRRNPTDRRSHALYLTDKGRQLLSEAQQVAAAHEALLAASLTGAERRELTRLLRAIADAQHLDTEGLPGTSPAAASPAQYSLRPVPISRSSARHRQVCAIAGSNR
jgi:DNA-binding MarR family transcriptional regulator